MALQPMVHELGQTLSGSVYTHHGMPWWVHQHLVDLGQQIYLIIIYMSVNVRTDCGGSACAVVCVCACLRVGVHVCMYVHACRSVYMCVCGCVSSS